jgi:outer membrane protein assembly factor BamB
MKMLDKDNIIFGFEDGLIQIYSISNRAFTCNATFTEFTDSPALNGVSVINSLQFAVSYCGSFVYIRNNSCQILRKSQISASNYGIALSIEAISNSTLAVGTRDGFLLVLNASNMTVINAMHNINPMCSLVLYDNQLLIGDSFGSILLWNSTSYTNTLLSMVVLEGNNPIKSIVVYQTNRMAVASGIKIYIVSLDWQNTLFNVAMTLIGHTDTINCVALISGMLYSGSSDGTVRAWNATSGNLIGNMSIGGAVYSLISKTGNLKTLMKALNLTRIIFHSCIYFLEVTDQPSYQGKFTF